MKFLGFDITRRSAAPASPAPTEAAPAAQPISQLSETALAWLRGTDPDTPVRSVADKVRRIRSPRREDGAPTSRRLKSLYIAQE